MDRSALMGRYIVGAYATSPNLFSWNKDSEAVFFDRLKVLNSIRGLELPFWGKSLHQFDDQWLLSNLHPDWQNVLTCVPGTMKNLESDPYFGLASKKQSSRKNAINFYAVLAEYAKLIVTMVLIKIKVSLNIPPQF